MMCRVLVKSLVTICLCVVFSVVSTRAQLAQTPQEQAQQITARAVEAFNSGRMADAEAQLQESLQLAENIYETHFWLGRVYATRAGSSVSSKGRAITEFRRALELQPYGEDGELARGWLLRIGGRPKAILFTAATHPLLTDIDWSATRGVIEALQGLAQQSGFDVVEMPRRAIDLSNPNSQELTQHCEDEAGSFKAGWMVCVGVGKFTTSSNAKSGYHASGNARAWIFDPLVSHLYPSVAVNGTSSNLFAMLLGLKDNSSSDAYKSGVDSLSSTIWDKCRRTIALNSDPAVLDETTFPLRTSGVYGRAAVPYQEALRLPLVGFVTCTAAAREEDDSDAAKTLGMQLQQALLKSGKVAVISPGNMEEALTALEYSATSTNPQEWSAAGQSNGSRYIIFPVLTQFNIRTKNWIVHTKVTAQATLTVKVLDTQTGQFTFSKTYDEKLSAGKFLGGQAIKTVIAKQTEALEKVGETASKELLQFLTKQTAESGTAEQKKPDAPMPAAAVQQANDDLPYLPPLPENSVKEDDLPYLPPEPDSKSEETVQEIELGAPLLIVKAGEVQVVLVPVEGLARWAGARIRADGEVMKLRRGDHTLELRSGSVDGELNERAIRLSAPAKFRNEVFYAPIGQVAEGVGGKAVLESNNRVIRLTLDDGRVGLMRLP